VASLAEEEAKAAAVKAAAADERAAAVLAQVKEVARRQEQVLASAAKARNRAEAEPARQLFLAAQAKVAAQLEETALQGRHRRKSFTPTAHPLASSLVVLRAQSRCFSRKFFSSINHRNIRMNIRSRTGFCFTGM